METPPAVSANTAGILIVRWPALGSIEIVFHFLI